jgi:RHH-type proline utilization regulon transcriptional repressor/proline dehydrogenase/delta 1-pyrroline-5-carboxylate dehydrogenase
MAATLASGAIDWSAQVERAVELAGDLQDAADHSRSRRERARAARLARLLSDPDGLSFVLALTDEVLRVRDPARAARLLKDLYSSERELHSLGSLDRAALVAGSALGGIWPAPVLWALRRRVLYEMGDVVLPVGRGRLAGAGGGNRLDSHAGGGNQLASRAGGGNRLANYAGWGRLAAHALRRRRQGIRLNVNILGEEVLGEEEAERRLNRVLEILRHPLVDYVSVKVSSICSQLDVLRFDHEVERVAVRLRRLLLAAGPKKLVNLDMEQYRDLELTLAVFRRVLDEPRFEGAAAGVALQAYLPDSLHALEELCSWARARHQRAGSWIRVRLVKGANLAMERVEAEMRGWPQAPFTSKADTDANYKRMLEVALDPANKGAVRVGVASHNLFELAWAIVRSEELNACSRMEMEMLEGMSPAASEAVATRAGSLRLYVPVVLREELDSAIAYLVRRLDEHSSPENFLAHQFSMRKGSPSWREEESRFRAAVQQALASGSVKIHSRRAAGPVQPRPEAGFTNEPDTDFTQPASATG